MKLNIEKIAEEVFQDKELIIENLKDDKVKIWYKAPHVTNLKPFIFPRFIKLDEEFVEGVGLYFGDGKLSTKYIRHTDYSTIDEDIGKFILDFFRKLGIRVEHLTLQLSYSNQVIEEIKYKWSKILSVQKNKSKIRKHSNSRKDCLHIHINNIVFGKIFRKILEECLNQTKNVSKLRKAFLRGHFAADGGIETRKNKKSIQINYLTFAYHKTNEVWLRDFIIEYLKAEGIDCIKIKESKNTQTACIRVGLWKNFVVCSEISLFERCIRKKELFLNIVRNSNFYLKLNEKFHKKLFALNISQKEIAKIINCKSDGETCDIIHGKHLLRVEQINNILKFNGFNWNDVISNLDGMRFGQVGYIPINFDFVNFILKEKKLV